MTPEGQVKRRVDRMLNESGVWWFSPQSGPYGRSGIPDRLACVRGHLVAIEVKADASKSPTRLQTLCMERMRASGAAVFVVYDDVTLNVVREYIYSCL